MWALARHDLAVTSVSLNFELLHMVEGVGKVATVLV